MFAGAVRQPLVMAARTVASKEGGDDRMGQAASGSGCIAMLMRRVVCVIHVRRQGRSEVLCTATAPAAIVTAVSKAMVGAVTVTKSTDAAAQAAVGATAESREHDRV